MHPHPLDMSFYQLPAINLHTNRTVLHASKVAVIQDLLLLRFHKEETLSLLVASIVQFLKSAIAAERKENTHVFWKNFHRKSALLLNQTKKMSH
ncbi:hypothetical protein VNO77_17702 [Canavalia gladiata]|uniref:Uncharacterized protein n=1 Tax=Canavalia gladiata TaxID=3824 RepID=A0AAN9QIZ4_CANGL